MGDVRDGLDSVGSAESGPELEVVLAVESGVE